jgi:hypothetical protein
MESFCVRIVDPARSIIYSSNPEQGRTRTKFLEHFPSIQSVSALIFPPLKHPFDSLNITDQYTSHHTSAPSEANEPNYGLVG